MKKTLLFATLLVLFFSLHSYAQLPGRQYARGMTSIYKPNYVDSFLVFKPADSSTGTHPLIIFLHGAGESSGTVANIASASKSIPWYCANDYPMRFKNPVDNQYYTFYVLSPKNYGNFGGSWTNFYVKDMIAWAKSNLNIDSNRIYLTGLSLGGGGTWNFITDSLAWVNKIAAAAPVAPLQEMTDENICSIFNASHLPIWDFHCKDDGGQTSAGVSQHAKDITNACSPVLNPFPRYTFYVSGGHPGSWENAYDTGHITRNVDSTTAYSGNQFASGGSNVSYKATVNLYEWFLSHSRSTVITPTVSAGSDQTIYTTSATLTGSASVASPVTITGYSWTVVSGPPGSSFSANTSDTTDVNNLVPGTYVFRLTVTASNSETASDEISVTVISPNPIANAGNDQTITLPTNTATLSGTGTPVNGATIQTYAWVKSSGPSGGTLSNAAIASPTVTSLVQGVYTYRLTVTDNNGRTGSDSMTITVNAATGCKVVWTSTPGSLGDIKTAFNLVPCDTVKIKSGTYNYLYIANSRFDGDVYVLPSDSGVLFTGGWTISNVKNIVFRDFKFKDISGRALSIQNNTDSCVFERFNMHNIGDYCINIDGSATAYDGTAATRFDDLQFIDDSVSKAGPANVFTHINAVTKNLVIRRAVIDSTTGSGSCIAFTDKSINVLIEDSKFTNINIGGTQHNSVMFIKGSGTIRRNYGFSIYGDFIRARPLTFDSTAGHSTPDSLWIYNNRMVSSDKYAFAEMQQGLGDTTTNTSLPNTRTGVGIFLNNTAGNLRSRDYWGGVNNGGGGAMFDIYDWVRTPIFKNNLGFRTYLDSVPDPANPPSQYNFDYMFHNGGGVKPAGQPVFGDTSNNLYRHIAAQLGINDTLTMKISDSSIARHAGTNIYSYKFNTDFEGEARGSSWDIGADQNNNSVVQPPQPPYYGMDSVFIGGRNCLVKRPTEDPAYTSTKIYPLILEIGDQDENLANNPSGLVGLFKSGTPKLVVANANIYPNDMNGNPIYYIMAKIQPLNYGDVVFPNEITPFVTGILAAYPIDTSKYANGMYRRILLAGQERGADAWFNCTNWALSNGFGSNEPTWVYKIRKIVTSRVNNINNGNTTSTAIWQTFNGRTLRYFEPTDWNTVPDSTKARIARFSDAYQQLYRMNASNAAVYDSMYSIYGPDTLTNIYRLLVDDSSSSGGDYITGISQSAGELMTAEKQTGLLVSPNPVRNILFVSNDKEIRQAAIYSLNGQRLLTKTGTAGILQMNMTSLPKGIYVLQVIDKNGSVQTRRVLKE